MTDADETSAPGRPAAAWWWRIASGIATAIALSATVVHGGLWLSCIGSESGWYGTFGGFGLEVFGVGGGFGQGAGETTWLLFLGHAMSIALVLVLRDAARRRER